MKQTILWNLTYSDEKMGTQSELFPATVPGCVQLDMVAAGKVPSYLTGDHEEEYRWMENKFWHYKAQITVEDCEEFPFLCLDGVDYEYEVLLNNQCVLYHEGMFTSSEIDLSPYKGQTISVEVCILPAPKVKDCVYVRGLGNEAAQSCKPAFNYGWDWSPRIVTLGIVKDAYVEYRPLARLTEVQLSYRLNDELTAANITLTYGASVQGDLVCTITDPDGKTALKEKFLANGNKKELTLRNPLLWWPHNHGMQPVYSVTVQLFVNGRETDSRTVRLGFRRSRMVANENTWAEQIDTADLQMFTCAKAPMTLELNGRRIFAKGSNWVPPELSIAQMKKDHIMQLLTLLKEANMNIIRMWGGGYIHPDWFYDMCDDLGIMVWAEFPLACAEYKDNDRYLAVLEQEARAIIPRLRTHPCVVIWCGGNELFTDAARMTPQHKAMRILNALTYEMDQDTPYIYTSPQAGAAHGPYDILLRNKREPLSVFCESRNSAYVEFGCGTVSEWDYLGTFMTSEERANPFRDSIWDKRHATTWFDPEEVRLLTGCPEDWESIVNAGNEAQCVMYPAMFEEVRRQWPHASMAINWCFNEPWPTAAGNGLVNYPAKPRPNYQFIKDALRGQKLSLRFVRIAWHPGEEMTVSAWLLNDTAEAIHAGTAQISVVANGVEQILGT